MSKVISIDSDVLGGKPRIKGTRVSVDQVYEMHKIQKMTPGEVADVLTTVDKSEVKEAIDYAKRHDMSTGFPSNKAVSKN